MTHEWKIRKIEKNEKGRKKNKDYDYIISIRKAFTEKRKYFGEIIIARSAEDNSRLHLGYALRDDFASATFSAASSIRFQIISAIDRHEPGN